MHVKDLKRDFYDVICGQKVILFVHLDIDAICACKILQGVLKCGSCCYTFVPIYGLKALKQGFEEHAANGCRFFVLINCGATIDLENFLAPGEEVVLFLWDSHRPTNVSNIFNSEQIQLLWNETEDVDVPRYEELFRDDELSDGEETSENSDRLSDEVILKRREQRLWEDNRNRLLFEYTQFSYHGRASSLGVFELAHRLSKDSNEMAWCCAVALTSQYLFGQIESSDYVLSFDVVLQHAQRLQLATNSATNDDIQNIIVEPTTDLKLVLYKHWSVEESLRHSPIPACKLRTYSSRGETHLNELLVEIGLPLAQANQNFSSMDLELKREFQKQMEKAGEKQGMDLSFPSISLQQGYQTKFTPSDFVYAMLGLLECCAAKKVGERFQDALDLLPNNSAELFHAGADHVKILLAAVAKQVQSAIEMKRISTAGPFLYVNIQENVGDAQLFGFPHSLRLFAHHCLTSFVSRRVRGAAIARLPLVVFAPHHQSDSNSCLVLGLPPVSQNSPKNFFGKAFEQAAESTKAKAVFDFFDSSFLVLNMDDRTAFMDSLTSLLA